MPDKNPGKQVALGRWEDFSFMPLAAVLILLMSGFAQTSSSHRSGSGTPVPYDVRHWGMSPSASPDQNTAALARIFSSKDTATFRIPAGVYALGCGSGFVASGAVSLLGAGPGKSVLRFDHPCTLEHPLMQWMSKSGVHLSGFTIDLNHSHFGSVQSVLSFEAYEGDAAGLRIDHLAILNGTPPSFLIGAAASGGFSYRQVMIDHNRLEMVPGRSQNQCIALSTVNNSGKIPGAKILGNVCRGSAIQGDGEGPEIANNDVSGYEFGQGIFLAYVTKANVTAASWADGETRLRLDRGTSHIVPGETVYVWGIAPSTYDGTFTVQRVDGSNLSYYQAKDPGNYFRGGFISPQPSSRHCLIHNNFIHDTVQTTDVNTSAPGGIEDNCIDSLVENNLAGNLGGSGFINFADGSKYIHNSAIKVGYSGAKSAGGLGDNAGFVVFDNGSGIKGYSSSGVTFENNYTEVHENRPKFGYFEEPYHVFNIILRRNSFNGSERSMVVRQSSCEQGKSKC